MSEAYLAFIAKYNKRYESYQEFEERFKTFMKTYNYVKNHDSKKEGFELELNMYADLTDEEFKSRMLGLDTEAALNEIEAP